MFAVPPADWRRAYPRPDGRRGFPVPDPGSYAPPTRLGRLLGVGPGGSGRPPDPAGRLIPRTVVGLAAWSLVLAAVLGVVIALGFAASQARIAEREQARLGQSRGPAGDQGDVASPAPSVSPSPSPSDPLAELVGTVGRSVVVVEDFDPSGTGTSGSGFVLQATPRDIWVITSYTVVRGARTAGRPVKIRLPNFQRLDGSVRSSDPDRDVAVVVVSGENLPSLNRFAAPVTQPGAPVLVLGVIPSSGKVTGTRATVSQVLPDGLLLEAPGLASASGGPVLDADGNLVGVLPVQYVPKGQAAPGLWVVPAQLLCRRLVVCPRAALGVDPSASPSAAPSPSPR